ncbi:MAG: hypothetical protein SFU56_10230 [Capsulimonadales bacterium]|nr:hypothetical protein [Capsulimonadales bacterium]
MAFYTTDDFLREANRQMDGYRERMVRFEELARDTETKRRDLATRLMTAYSDLGAALLPDLSATAFSDLAARLGLPELNGIFRNGSERQARIDQRLDQIETSDLYRTREQQVYELQKQLEEVRPAFEHARADWDALNRLPRCRELVERQYGTPQYPHRGWLRFFNGQYLSDWRHADEIIATLRVSAFPEVIDRYRERQEQVEVLGRSVSDLQSRLNAIQAVLQERDNLLQERNELPARVHEQVGRTVAPLLDKIDLTALPNADTLKGRGVVLDGMEHQIRYLDDLSVKVRQDLSQLAQRANRLEDEQQRYASDRYRYRNKRFSQEQFDKRFDRRRIERYDVLYNRYNRAGTTIYVFDDYYRASPLEEFLWWDVMTDGRIDGNFIPEVQEYRAMNPGYVYERPMYERPEDTSSVSGFSDFGDNS